MHPTSQSRRHANWLGRLAVLVAIGLAGAGAWLALSLATTEEETAADDAAGGSLIAEGRALNDQGRNRKAARVLGRALKQLPAGTPERVRATVNFELGMALRGAGRFGEAIKPLKRSRRLGISAAAAGLEIAKARSGIRN